MTTEIEWGAIALTGPQMKALREAGMPGDVLVRSPDGREYPAEVWAFDYNARPYYALPAQDPSYLCHVHNEANGDDMAPNYGGEGPPADYDDSKPVLLRSGRVVPAAARWDLGFFSENPGDDIIGYHALPKQEEVAGEVPEWAYAEVNRLSQEQGGRMSDAFARYIAQHEQPPVDPDLIEARRLAANDATIQGKRIVAGNIEDGHLDDDFGVPLALAAIKRGRELAQVSK